MYQDVGELLSNTAQHPDSLNNGMKINTCFSLLEHNRVHTEAVGTYYEQILGE